MAAFHLEQTYLIHYGRRKQRAIKDISLFFLGMYATRNSYSPGQSSGLSAAAEDWR